MKKPLLLLIFLFVIGLTTAYGQIRLGYVNNPYSELYIEGYLKKDLPSEGGEPDTSKCYLVGRTESIRNSRRVKDILLLKINGRQMKFTSAPRRSRGDHDYPGGTISFLANSGYQVHFREHGSAGKERITLTINYKGKAKAFTFVRMSMGD